MKGVSRFLGGLGRFPNIDDLRDISAPANSRIQYLMETRVSKPVGAVSAEDVKKIARLSRLHVEADRLQPLADDLNGILGWIEQLNEVDVEGVEPMTSAVDMSAPMRKDEISDGGKRDDILKNAPKKDDGFFVVPRSVE